MKPLFLFSALLFISISSVFISCGPKSKYATDEQVKMYDSLQSYMKQDRACFLKEASTWKGEKAVVIVTDIMDKDLDELLEKHNLSKPEEVSALLMNMSLWVDIHKDKYETGNGE
ncbi:MAG: hypothetical protein MUC87_12125 [Bacteroidia bacterium]|nr:hypothetical protein [Bacteroidia bacterium]